MALINSVWLNYLLLAVFFLINSNSTVIMRQNYIPLVAINIQDQLKNFRDNFVNSLQKAQLSTGKNVGALNEFFLSSQKQSELSQKDEDIKFKLNSLTSTQISLENTRKDDIDHHQQKGAPDQQPTLYSKNIPLISAFGRQLDNKIIEYVKKNIAANRQFINTQNSMRNAPYKLGQNRFIIYTPDQFKSIFLTLKQPHDSLTSQQQLTVEYPNLRTRHLQQNFTAINWKTLKKMTSVKYQQECGACYSFTAIGAIESAYLIRGQNLNLAEQQIIDCSTAYENYGCVGGWTINAYKYIKDFGIAFESDYPYAGVFNNCTIGEDKTKYSIQNYVEIANDCNAVISALRNQPLSIAINADGWQHYSSGVYTDCRVGGSNHGVVLAGVDADNWLIKNSWGFTWGQSGYIRVSRTAPNNACNVCRWASYPVL